ncbi:MAG: TlpA disulfide reductase family protein [Mucilaginibacter sp.]|uniref:peroxiredoxin family protein n=1 Tax=Mucilaginibacter sp. TaxID=1882438 RepID=UPI0035647A26
MNGIIVPDFSAKTLDGKIFQLKHAKGKVVVLNFWFVACSPCRAEMPSLNKIVSSFKNDDVVFVSVALDKEADLKQFLRMNRFLFQTIADPTFIITDKTFHIKNFPTTIVIDKKGIIKLFTMGSKDTAEAIDISLDENLVRAIDDCLGKKYQKKMIFDNPPGFFKL